MTALEELKEVFAAADELDRLAALVAARKGRIELSEVEHLPSPQLSIVARALLNWNCNQPVSDAKHEQHYRKYIQPIHQLRDRRWKDLIKRHEDRDA